MFVRCAVKGEGELEQALAGVGLLDENSVTKIGHPRIVGRVRASLFFTKG